MDASEIRKKLEDEIKLFPYLGTFPIIDNNVFLASGVKIIGDVKILENSSVWYNTVIRGDVNYIRIGKMTNIQDCSMLHVTNKRFPLNIGNKVTIGHSVSLHGCTVKDLCLIGIGSVILDGAEVNEKSIIAAGAVVKPNFIIPAGTMAAGVPAKIIRDLTDDELNEFEKSALRYKKYAEVSIQSIKKYNY